MRTSIVFRAFQGMGGSGIYSLSTIMGTMMVPPAKFATYVAITTSVFAISSVLGPLLGGAINDSTTWRWVFYLKSDTQRYTIPTDAHCCWLQYCSGPGGAVALALIASSIPFGFPYGKSNRFFRSMIEERAWKRIDVLGAFLSLATSILLVFALEEGGMAYPWNSGAVIASFILSGLLWTGFIIWRESCQSRNLSASPCFLGG